MHESVVDFSSPYTTAAASITLRLVTYIILSKSTITDSIDSLSNVAEMKIQQQRQQQQQKQKQQ